jgi:hypothetical protein
MTVLYGYDEWNSTMIALIEALLGSISPNFRMVTLDAIDQKWKVTFVLERDDASDREAIQEVMDAFEIIREIRRPVLSEIVITRMPLPRLERGAGDRATMYRRRETIEDQ